MQNQMPNTADDAGDSSEKKSSGTEQPTAQTAGSRPPIHQPKTGAQQAEPDRLGKHWLEYATGFFAFIAAIAAILAAIFGGWQASVASDNEVRQLRAYVHITGGTIAGSGSIAGPLEITIQPGVKVYGQTPAGEIIAPWALVVDQWPMTEAFQFNYLKTHMQSTGSQGPGEEHPIEAKTRTITKDEMMAIGADTKRLYAYGTILYRDVFNNSRFTNFCWLFDVEGIAKRNASNCPIHNGADWSEAKPSTVMDPMK